MAQPGGKQATGEDPGLNFLLITGLLLLGLVVVWFLFRTQIAGALLWLFYKVAGMWLWAPWAQTDYHYAHMELLREMIPRIDRGRISIGQLADVGNRALRNLTPVVVPFCAYLIHHVWTSAPAARFHSVMTFSALVKRMNPMFPATTPVLNLDLIRMDPDKGPWRRMDDYISFALRHKLLRSKQGAVITALGDDEHAWTFCMKEAVAVFATQLGPRTQEVWPHLRQQAPHYYVLAAVFAARLNQDKDAANDLLDRVARTFKEGKSRSTHYIDVAAADKLWKKHGDSKAVHAVIDKHAFINVAMSSLLHTARFQSGVLQPAWFLWLKPTDRTLWYALHQVGLRVGNIEAGGVRAHLLAEMRYGAAITTPYVMQAAMALRESLSDETWINPKSPDYRPMETFTDDSAPPDPDPENF